MLKIALAQLDLLVGDIEGNLKKLIAAANTARDELKADVIVFPELSLTGYPPEDLLFRQEFTETENNALQEFIKQVRNIYCVIGHTRTIPEGLLNSCSLIYNNAILGTYAKQHLPNYGVFDEPRYFIPGHAPCVIPIKGIPVGLIICEDLWHPEPIQQAAEAGAQIIISPNASPFEIDKHEKRHLMLCQRAKSVNLPIVYVNHIGGQDDLIFDGGSMVVNSAGKICQHAGFFTETVSLADTGYLSPIEFVLPCEEKIIYDALVLAVRDYVKKNNFPGALIGVSGGIDSALTLAIAVDALGKENVSAISLPSRYTLPISMEDAAALVKNLDVKQEIISIEPAFTAFLDSLAPSFKDKKSDITEENLQARCRGIIMMAFSNKFGRIVLTTSNRSEMAVGYATLYGDMAGGFAVLKDVPKMLVYRLAHYRNTIQPVIPEHIIERAPTAELAFDQKDEDSLPPYPILDKILELYINEQKSVKEIIAQGFESETVKKIAMLINRNEYKRRQAPIGPRINHTAFGRDRRYPITCVIP